MENIKHISPDEFYANDLFNQWQELSGKAKSSIKIFTPYLDFTINNLLKDVGSHVKVTIITSLDGDTFFQRGYQLNALKEAIESGKTIKNLAGLHAKILLIDDSLISLGSQNFTNRGRKNKEAGMISQVSFEGSELLTTLKIWLTKSKDVNLELIDKLSQFLNQNEEEISRIKNKFETKIEKILADFYQKEVESQILNSIYYNSTYRFAQGEVILTRKIPPPSYNYYSFFAGEHNDLCRWLETNPKGHEKQIDLIEYTYYPALNINSMQMAFLRIHRSRITFMKTNFKPNKFGFEIRKTNFELDFSFLKKNAKISNIKVSLKNDAIGNVNLYYLFNGFEFSLIKTKYNNSSIESFINENLILNMKKHKEFLKFLIEPVKFTTVWYQPKEIEKFLPEYNYRLGILEYDNCPILILNKK